jgi:hypothetical protein
LSPKMQVSKTKSNLQTQPSEEVAESTVEEFSRVLRQHFGIFNEPVPHKPYAVRYTGEPYNQSDEDCKSIQVFTHAKGTMLSPLCIYSVLSKFEIPVQRYTEAVVGQGKLIRMKPQSVPRPNEN